MSEGESENARRSTWLLALVLMAVYLAVRLPGLMALPIFGDEAIYLRWAQFAAGGDLWRSVIDPKPPLHFWIIGAFLWASDDPLKVARGVSVVAGMLTVPALMGLSGALEPMIREPRLFFARRDRAKNEPVPPTGRTVGVVAAVMTIFCPFLAFYQRMGLADALVVLENVATLWAGVALARWAWEKEGNRKAWRLTIALGVLTGLSMLTRQIVTYLFPFLVVLAFASLWRGEGRARAAKRFFVRFALAMVIALAVWSPYFAGLPSGYHVDRDAAQPVTGESVKTEVRNRILYQPNFAPPQSFHQRLEQIVGNAKKTLVPTRAKDAPRDADPLTGWYWVYLTPGVLAVCALSALWMGARQQWRLLGFLLGWFALLVGPIILFGTVVFSRYVLVGAVPLLIVGAYGVVDVIGWVSQRSGSRAGAWGTALALGAALFVLPLRDIRLQATQWWEQPFVGPEGVAGDRYQYVTGWTAGLGAREATAYLRDLSRTGPIVVITRFAEWGNPGDAIWAYLEGRPNVSLFCVDVTEAANPGRGDKYVTPVLRRGEHGGYMLCKRKWSYRPPEEVHLPPGAIVAVVVNHPVHADRDVPAVEYLTEWKSGPVEDVRVFPFGKLQSHGQEGEQVLVWLVGTVSQDGAIQSASEP